MEYYAFGESFAAYMGAAFVMVFLVVAPPITLLGSLLPLTWAAVGNSNQAGRAVGHMTAVNTLAAAAGALTASFLLLPWLGLWPSVVLLASLLYVAAFAILAKNGRLFTAIAGAIVFAGLSLLVLYNRLDTVHDAVRAHEEIVQRWNSAYGWIDVVRLSETGTFKVRQNLHYRFGTTGNNAREYRQAHIPLLLHERPSDVLFMGLGTGLTAGGAVGHVETEKIVAVELRPEVVKAARLLSEYNFGVVDHSKVEIRVDDARHYLLASSRRFDVIVSDLFVPWESQSGYLYTVEHYLLARRRMKAGGLFCQWLPLYQLGPREFELIADSFSSVFPVTTIWWGKLDVSKPVVALIGSQAPLETDPDRIAARIAALRQMTGWSDGDLATAEQFYNNYQGDWTQRNPSSLNTDEHPRVEFLAPISNRDFKMIRGSALRDYYDAVLARLPSGAVVSASQKGLTSVEQRRAWQQLILFGEVR